MKRSSQPRATAELSKSLHRRLNTYALAASAAATGMLALTQPSEAKVVYTPANKAILYGDVLRLDLNNDGLADFYFYLFTSIGAERGPSLFASKRLQLTPLQSGDQILGAGTLRNRVTASALPAGAHIGPKRKFSPGQHLMATTNYGCTSTNGCRGSSGGPWKEARKRYLGLKFVVKGKIHYGWARLTVDADWGKGIQARLTGYAYETIPNKAIVAGKTSGPDLITLEPASLGHLAAGASAIPAWRSGK
jgi:hypothetical protein